MLKYSKITVCPNGMRQRHIGAVDCRLLAIIAPLVSILGTYMMPSHATRNSNGLILCVHLKPYNHIYLKHLSGEDIQVTNGDWEVTKFHGIDEENNIFYSSNLDEEIAIESVSESEPIVPARDHPTYMEEKLGITKEEALQILDPYDRILFL